MSKLILRPLSTKTKGVYSKTKEFTPLGTNSFPLKQTPFLKDKNKQTKKKKKKRSNKSCASVKNGRKIYTERPFAYIGDLSLR